MMWGALVMWGAVVMWGYSGDVGRCVGAVMCEAMVMWVQR